MQDIVLDLDAQAKKDLNDTMDEAIVEQLKVSIEDLIRAAKQFKKAMIITMDESGIHYSLSNYKILFEFQEKIQLFLGNRPTKIIYVMETKDNVFSYMVDAKEFGEKFVNSEGRVTALSKQFRKNNETIESKIEEQNHILKAKNAFLGTRNRLNVFWNKAKSSQKQSGVLLWKEKKKWEKARILNLGDVKEAYATALMIRHQDKLDKLCEVEDVGIAPYYSHDLISNFFYNYLNKVTNLPAIVEEDINQENLYQFDKIQYQYGVKSKRASAPNIGLYKVFADQLLKNANEEWIKSWIKSKKENEAKRNLLFKDLTKAAREELELQLKPIMRSLTKQFN